MKAKSLAANDPLGQQAGLATNGEASRDGPLDARITFSTLGGWEKSSIGRPPSYREATLLQDVIETIERSFEKLMDDLRGLSLEIHGTSSLDYNPSTWFYPDVEPGQIISQSRSKRT